MLSLPITAILPCFNHEMYLHERIRSLLHQSVRVSEIIFLDDASTDDSVRIARELLTDCGIDVSFHVNDVNSGSPFVQWNRGVSLAKYPIIWVAETDDTCHTDLLKEVYNAYVSANASVAYAHSRYIDSLGEDMGSLTASIPFIYRRFFSSDFVLEGRDFNADFMSRCNMIPNASAVLFSRDAFIRAGAANQTMRFCGDWDLWIRLARSNKVAFVSHELNYFRCHRMTTRTNVRSPSYLAESLACRLTAIVISQSKALTCVSDAQLISCIIASKPSVILFMLSQLSLPQFLSTSRAYKKLDNVPPISYLAWTLFFILFCFQRVLFHFSRFARRKQVLAITS
jgi:glycosyltransferase involved in cell wall biosynthesis